MLKLLLCLLSILTVSAVMLELRQQHLNLSYQTNKLHNQIEARQAKLWNQQLQIAVNTAPNAIAKTVGDHAIKLAPRSPLPAQSAGWFDTTSNPDAE
jgi:cell division protein FtsL